MCEHSEQEAALPFMTQSQKLNRVTSSTLLVKTVTSPLWLKGMCSPKIPPGRKVKEFEGPILR